MKPIIGITSNIRDEKLLTTGLCNVHSIANAGGVPVVLPNLADCSDVERIANSIDGLLVTGGGDVDPTIFGEEPHPQLGEVCPERDRFEIMMITEVLKLDKPIFGICRGSQMINVAEGGDLFQDIYSQHSNQLLQHRQNAPRSHPSHYVEVVEGSLLHDIAQSARFKVNSYHHQAVRRLPEAFEVCARASDGIVEGFESKKHRFVLGVQWHPENLTRKQDVYSLKLFNAFVKACQN